MLGYDYNKQNRIFIVLYLYLYAVLKIEKLYNLSKAIFDNFSIYSDAEAKSSTTAK